ncbi:hypothetical protein I3J09_07240 [Streptomyces clavuligerus]|uniref:Delta-aminolevulinic acid dehydratase n=1 Tax=Streptomyces clavuligerus TaxID=1901 RepID=B5GKY8_STRCL|nr:hypothetical protein D1794_07430 [Streptomyces clavuligerus]EDY46984.1 conserved hypothetical protein [Streptomyces clavuligerus]EFG09412.1 Delta-aminolevulinic acid dehydratase [Streptomyces clavuligerus]MBY6302473.1 hypothetical protein [Streptomyces clavuligerus]QCS05353.1 hypothetical protein CRV15_06860 [Streptomyces clavuligerus]
MSRVESSHVQSPVRATSPLRTRRAVRHLLESQTLSPADLGMVLLVTVEPADRPMPTVTVAEIPAVVREAARLGIRSVKLFAESTERDTLGEVALAEDSLMSRAIHACKDTEPALAVMTETCLCSYTPDGLCYLTDRRGRPDIKATVWATAAQALAHAEAGADIVGPASMVLGTVRAARKALDETGHEGGGIMPHVIFWSSLYGAFRETMGPPRKRGSTENFRSTLVGPISSSTRPCRWKRTERTWSCWSPRSSPRMCSPPCGHRPGYRCSLSPCRAST